MRKKVEHWEWEELLRRTQRCEEEIANLAVPHNCERRAAVTRVSIHYSSGVVDDFELNMPF